jgi:hypothetical protein
VDAVKVQLSRYPTPASDDDYANASEELESRLRELPGIVAVYRTGSVSVPGISDLDRIAVVQPGSRVPGIWPVLSAQTRLLAMHGPFLVDTATFARHRWFADLQPLELAWGDEVEVETRPAPERIELVIAAESLVVVLLNLVKQAIVGRAKVRPTLCQLNNFRRDLDLARLERADAPQAWSFADQVTRLREEWWRLPLSERPLLFRALLDRSFAAIAEALRVLAKRMNHGTRQRRLRLSGVWKNVTLEAGEPPVEWKPRALWPVTAHSARVAEAFWRWPQRKVAVPGGVISIVQPSPGYEELQAQRREIIQRYVQFLGKTDGYAAIGAAGVFAS